MSDIGIIANCTPTWRGALKGQCRRTCGKVKEKFAQICRSSVCNMHNCILCMYHSLLNMFGTFWGSVPAGKVSQFRWHTGSSWQTGDSKHILDSGWTDLATLRTQGANSIGEMPLANLHFTISISVFSKPQPVLPKYILSCIVFWQFDNKAVFGREWCNFTLFGIIICQRNFLQRDSMQ